MLPVIVQDQRTRDGRRADDIGVDPERDAVVAAPVFASKLSGRYQVFLLPAAVNLGDIGSRTDSQRTPAILGADVG